MEPFWNLLGKSWFRIPKHSLGLDTSLKWNFKKNFCIFRKSILLWMALKTTGQDLRQTEEWKGCSDGQKQKSYVNVIWMSAHRHTNTHILRQNKSLLSLSPYLLIMVFNYAKVFPLKSPLTSTPYPDDSSDHLPLGCFTMHLMQIKCLYNFCLGAISWKSSKFAQVVEWMYKKAELHKNIPICGEQQNHFAQG